jgi:hypothetical protein
MNVTELKDNYPDKFTKEYGLWAQDAPYEDWWAYVYADAIEDGEVLGFDIDDIKFSGFWSQGDGASWHGRVRLDTFISKNYDAAEPATLYLLEMIRLGWIAPSIGVHQNGRSVHEMSMTCDGVEDYVNFAAKDDAVVPDGPYAGANVIELASVFGLPLLLDDLEKTALDSARYFASEIYIRLRDEYEWLTSEEQFIEHCLANDVEFDVDD